MMPIGDDNSGRTITPYVNYLLIAANIFVFIFYQAMGTNEAFLMSFATVPEEILTNTDITSNGLGVTPIPVYATMLTAMFMHGSIAHLFGNMLYLWIFGDNLENVMGHLKYFLFYITCGIIATLSHVIFSSILGSGMLIPSLGASGAISGVLGGYMLLFPRNRVRVIALAFIINVPAVISLGIWIALQVISGMGMLGGGQEEGGVAYAAHIGGFIAGLLLAKLFVNKSLSYNRSF